MSLKSRPIKDTTANSDDSTLFFLKRFGNIEALLMALYKAAQDKLNEQTHIKQINQ